MARQRPLPSEHISQISAMSRLLADPTRVRVLAYLSGGEACVCDIVDAVGVSQPLLSHHLRALRAAGLVRDRRAGRWTYYAIVVERLAEISELLSSLGAGHFSTERRECR